MGQKNSKMENAAATTNVGEAIANAQAEKKAEAPKATVGKSGMVEIDSSKPEQNPAGVEVKALEPKTKPAPKAAPKAEDDVPPNVKAAMERAAQREAEAAAEEQQQKPVVEQPSFGKQLAKGAVVGMVWGASCMAGALIVSATYNWVNGKLAGNGSNE